MKILNPCPKCGLVNIKLVPGHERQCRAVAPSPTPAVRPSVTHNDRDAQRDAQKERDAQPVRLAAAASPRATQAMTPAERQARRRAKDPEGWRQRHRDYMRRRRGAARAPSLGEK